MSARTRSNSFNYRPVQDIARPRGAACPLARDSERLSAIVGGVCRQRLALLRLVDRMRLFRSDTRDFADREIEAVRGLGQLYLDVSSKHAPDDFSVDLNKLTLEDECRCCPALERCPGSHRPDPNNVFVRDEARVRELVGSLAGDVLDVGAGLAPYASELEPAVRGGRARYLAIDADRARCELLRARYPWAEARSGTLEALEVGRQFSHVLFLRSLNHIADARGALARAAALLAPGGFLLVVDDTAFGLLRSQQQLARAEHSPAGFEHHRNASAEEAVELAQGLPLELVERRDVSAGGSNQWLLRWQKRERLEKAGSSP